MRKNHTNDENQPAKSYKQQEHERVQEHERYVIL